MADNLKEKTVSNLIWRLGERWSAQVIQLIVALVLARILEPAVYGSVALITVIIQILQVFIDAGLGNALIQKKDADDLDFSSVFYFNLLFCALIYAGVYAFAPSIARFYENAQLTAVVRVLGIMVLISGIKNIQQAYVSRILQFRKFFFSTLCGTLISAVVGIGLALRGFGIWALVGQQLTNNLVDTLILWITVHWRPKPLFSWKRLRGLVSYGWKLLAAALLDRGYASLRQMLIGKIYTETDLAFYNEGEGFPNLIVTNVNTAIDSVLLPVMSAEQDDRQRVKAMTRRSIKVSTYLMAPMMLGLMAVAEPLVHLILTDKWLECVPYMRIFCITYMFYPMHTANLNAIKAMGRSDLFLRLEIAKKLIGLLLLLVTVPVSVKAMAYSLLVSSFTSQLINTWPNRKLLQYGYLEQLKDVMPSILLAAGMSGIVWLVGEMPLPTILVIGLQILSGIILYWGGSALFRMESYTYIWQMVRGFKKHDRRDEK